MDIDDYMKQCWEEDPELMAEGKKWLDDLMEKEGVEGVMKYFGFVRVEVDVG